MSLEFLRSERMLEHFGVTENTWRDAGKKDKNFLESESPLFVGRAVVRWPRIPRGSIDPDSSSGCGLVSRSRQTHGSGLTRRWWPRSGSVSTVPPWCLIVHR
ncbi:MAG: hypothetical protein LC791_12730 [Acidobacteria bacterium]|nr:hypothetical protein [Acidobacteriota bacterium]